MGIARVAILISGRGSNMQSLVRAAENPDYPAQIVGVITNKPSAEGLKFAAANKIATAVFQMKNYANKDETDAAISAQLTSWQVDMICLAGFMRVFSASFANQWSGKLINIHPSLLPKYKGLDTHSRALAAGDTEHGCTVHHVIPSLDDGSPIAQTRVPVLPNDTAQTLAARVLIEEHKLYPLALSKLLTQKH